MYFIVKTHSVLCLSLSNDKFYIHFGGSLEYWINEYEYGYEQIFMKFDAEFYWDMFHNTTWVNTALYKKTYWHFCVHLKCNSLNIYPSKQHFQEKLYL